MGCSSFQQKLVMLFLGVAFGMAVTPALSVVGWEERFMPNPKLCWAQINKADSCLHEMYTSLLDNKINLGADCCHAVQGLSQKCQIWVFNRGRFTPEFGNQIKDFCASSFGITLPPSQHVYFPQGQEGSGGQSMFISPTTSFP